MLLQAVKVIVYVRISVRKLIWVEKKKQSVGVFRSTWVCGETLLLTRSKKRWQTYCHNKNWKLVWMLNNWNPNTLIDVWLQSNVGSSRGKAISSKCGW